MQAVFLFIQAYTLSHPLPIHEAIHNILTGITRTETGKMISVLTRIFGTHHLEMVEDVVQDVMIKALEHWRANGIPEKPEAWLYRAAKNRAIDIIRQNKTQNIINTDIDPLLESQYTAALTIDEYFSDKEIRDDQLRMMFACCHPAIATEGQIALIMKTLCGFSIPQIARAFISKTDTIEKRLYRARQVFRAQNISFEIPEGNALQSRLDNVLEAIYLLFNEAHSTSYHKTLVREDLAADTIHLCGLLSAHEATALPQTDALLALLCFHTARLPSRTDDDGNLILMKEQDRSKWNTQMIQKGIYHLGRASVGNTINRYHLEAAIAYEHCIAEQYEKTDWNSILHYYDLLVQLIPSPVIMLNRAVAVKELEGAAAAITTIDNIPNIKQLQNYYLLHAILGELYTETGNFELAAASYTTALQLVVSDAEKKLIAAKLAKLAE